MSVDSAKIVQNMLLKRVDLFVNMLSLAQSKERGIPFIVVPFLSDGVHEANFSRLLFIAEISKLSHLNSVFFIFYFSLLFIIAAACALIV